MDKRGMTLVETIIYVGLAALVLTSFVSFSLTVAGLRSKNYVWAEVSSSGQVILDLVSREVRQAEAVISPAAGQASSTLILATASGTKMILNQNGILQIKLNDIEVGTLNSSQTAISDLIFTNLSSVRGPENIGFSFVLSSRVEDNLEFSARQSFRTAVSRRK
jgi:Tfp pilus assembly protein PilW